MDYADMSNFPFFVRARFRFYFQFKFNLNAVASCQLPVTILPCWRFAGWPLLGSADSDATRAEATLCQPTSSSTYSGGAIGVVLVVGVGVGVEAGVGAGAGPLCVQSNYFGVGHIKKDNCRWRLSPSCNRSIATTARQGPPPKETAPH